LIADNSPFTSTVINPSPSVEATPIPTDGAGIGATMDGLIADNSPFTSTVINPPTSVEATPIPTDGVRIGATMDGLIADNSPSTSVEATPISTEGVRIGATMDGLIADNSPSTSVEATPISTEGAGIGGTMDGLIADNSPSTSTVINPPTSVEVTPIQTEGVRIDETIDGWIADNSPSIPTTINPSPSTNASMIQAEAIDGLVSDNPTIINPSLSVEATPIPTEGVRIGETMDGWIADNLPSASTVINPAPSIEATPIQTEGMGIRIGETMDGLIADNSSSASTVINPSLSVEATAIPVAGLGIGEAMDGWISDNIAVNQLPNQISTNDPIANLTETDLSIAEAKSTDSNPDLASNNSKTKSNLAKAESSILKEDELPLTPIDGEDTITPRIVKGYATGGHVLEPDRVDRKPIAASDIIPAMLTPGEFIINAKDAQSNLDLLTHINSGGKLDRFSIGEATPTIIPESEPNESSADSIIDIDRSSIQRQNLSSNFIQPKAGIDSDRVSLLNNVPNDNRDRSISTNTNYSSPPLIFRKARSNIDSDVEQDTPDEWNSIEDLMNGMNNFGDSQSSPNGNSGAIQPMESPSSMNTSLPPSTIYAKTIPATDISTQLESVSTTIEAPTTNDRENDDAGELEILAREVYHRLRQRLEIERERHGSYSGNLPW
jgi:hypothetical protein